MLALLTQVFSVDNCWVPRKTEHAKKSLAIAAGTHVSALRINWWETLRIVQPLGHTKQTKKNVTVQSKPLSLNSYF